MAYKNALLRNKHKIFQMSMAFEKVTLKSLVSVTFKIKVTPESNTSISVAATFSKETA